jgi:protein-L-isoaspartate(D-aspartate) O-methyltransferase
LSKVRDPYIQDRRDMVERQILARGIKDERVLAAMEKVPRHAFVPPAYETRAYEDMALPIGQRQTISQPYIVALMTEAARIGPEGKVLEIGTGSGYQTAVLAELAKDVWTVEVVHPLAEGAKGLLERLGYANVHFIEGDGWKGDKRHAPYDAIMITCAVPELPAPLEEQVAEGGRIVAPVGATFQTLFVYEKKRGSLKESELAPVVFVPMTGPGVEGKESGKR